MEAIFSGLWKTIKSVAHLASPENVENPVQINIRQCDLLRKTIESVEPLASAKNVENPVQINSRQCDLLAKKACGVLHVVEELREVIEDGSKLPFALEELHRVLKDAESLIRDCCCGGQWLEVAITRGNLTEMFAKLLYDIEWHTSVLCGVLSDRSDVLDRSACEGKLGVAGEILLSQAAKQDRVSLQQRLEGTDLQKTKVDVELAAKFLAKLVAEEEENTRAVSSQSPLFLRVPRGAIKIGVKIGKGGSAEVKEVTWLGRSYALKLFPYGIAMIESFRKEIAAMVGLDHPHLVRVVCCLEDNNNIGIIMELMHNSLYDLLQELRRYAPGSGTTTLFPIRQSVDLMLQIGEGVKYLHSKTLAHRDLKSANILVQFADPDSPFVAKNIAHLDVKAENVLVQFADEALVAKIADFGLSAIKKASTGRYSIVGTTHWMPPELFGYEEKEMPEHSPRFHPFKMDAYSYGMLCYEILTGMTPFENVKATLAQTKKLVKNGLRPELPTDVTPTRLGMIIQRCWDKDSRKRPDFSTICTELRYIKGLLLQGKVLSPHFEETNSCKSVAVDLKPIIKKQGPWGGDGGGQFSDGHLAPVKQIKLKYETNPCPCIWYMKTTYDRDGKLFTKEYGDSRYGASGTKIEIDEPHEYLTQIEGSFGVVPVTVGGQSVLGLTSLTIRTTETTYGPFGTETGTKFKSETGKIIGFYGRCGMVIDQIGCFTAPPED